MYHGDRGQPGHPELLCDLLTDEGYAVALYAAPGAALADLERIKPDLIILDWLFESRPPWHGVLQIAALRTPWANFPVLICSAATRQIQELEPFLAQRGALLMYKPFLVDELCAAIETALCTAQGVGRPPQRAAETMS
jgi:DNA-binding response OmpR family regulator